MKKLSVILVSLTASAAFAGGVPANPGPIGTVVVPPVAGLPATPGPGPKVEHPIAKVPTPPVITQPTPPEVAHPIAKVPPPSKSPRPAVKN